MTRFLKLAIIFGSIELLMRFWGKQIFFGFMILSLCGGLLCYTSQINLWKIMVEQHVSYHDGMFQVRLVNHAQKDWTVSSYYVVCMNYAKSELGKGYVYPNSEVNVNLFRTSNYMFQHQNNEEPKGCRVEYQYSKIFPNEIHNQIIQPESN